MLLTIAFILIVLWVLGVIAHIGGGLIWLLAVAAIIIFLADRLFGRRTR